MSFPIIQLNDAFCEITTKIKKLVFFIFYFIYMNEYKITLTTITCYVFVCK